MSDTKQDTKKEAKQKELKFEFGGGDLFKSSGFSTDKIHEWRDLMANDSKIKNQSNIFFGNLNLAAQDEELLEKVKKEFETQSAKHNKSPTLEKALFKGLKPDWVKLDDRIRSTYGKITDVFRQLLPPLKNEGVYSLGDIGIWLKKIIDINDKLEADTRENIFSSMRKPVKYIFGENKTRYKSPQYEEFKTFQNTLRKKNEGKKKAAKNIAQPVIKLKYSRILELFDKLATDDTNENVSALFLAMLASGMREVEIFNKDINVKQHGDSPFEIELDGLGKQRSEERSKLVSWRPLIGGMTTAEFIKLISIIRKKDEKKDFKGKTKFLKKYFPEAFINNFDDKGEEIPNSKRPNSLRQAYIAVISDTEKYNPGKKQQRAYFTQEYFKHDPDFNTPLYYNKFDIVDDLANPEKKKPGCASESELQQEKAKNLLLEAEKKKLEKKAKVAEVKTFEKVVKKHRTEQQLIADGKAAIEKLKSEKKSITSRTLRDELHVGNDKISWLMSQLKGEKEKKKTESKKEVQEPVKEEIKEKPKKEPKKEDALSQIFAQALQKPDMEISADNTIARIPQRSNISLSNS